MSQFATTLTNQSPVIVRSEGPGITAGRFDLTLEFRSPTSPNLSEPLILENLTKDHVKNIRKLLSFSSGPFASIVTRDMVSRYHNDYVLSQNRKKAAPEPVAWTTNFLTTRGQGALAGQFLASQSTDDPELVGRTSFQTAQNLPPAVQIQAPTPEQLQQQAVQQQQQAVLLQQQQQQAAQDIPSQLPPGPPLGAPIVPASLVSWRHPSVAASAGTTAEQIELLAARGKYATRPSELHDLNSIIRAQQDHRNPNPFGIANGLFRPVKTKIEFVEAQRRMPEKRFASTVDRNPVNNVVIEARYAGAAYTPAPGSFDIRDKNPPVPLARFAAPV